MIKTTGAVPQPPAKTGGGEGPRVWVVMWADRHTDVEPTPFASEEGAVAWARSQAAPIAAEFDRHDDEHGEQPLNSMMRRAGWVWYFVYGESSAWVVGKTLLP